ncbi:MAG: hypothetical protein DI603_18235 [Roseateles depolymerans]|uniref:Uncharacterized protein n=1 Tax=Roseateles depolymerans TaxID=76731 RepID=A0A2W5DER3_9BURK|nr:MAG: hypothetical protein DI603_18235 [Roseateles depolymerans]
MKLTLPAETWFAETAIVSVDGRFEVRIHGKQVDPLDNLFRAPLPMAVVTVERDPKGSRAGFLRATANLLAAAPTMARALEAALKTGALAQHPEAEKAARDALRMGLEFK